MTGPLLPDEVTCSVATPSDIAIVSAWMRAFYAEGRLTYGPLTEPALRRLVANPQLGVAVVIRAGAGADGRPTAQGVGYFILTYTYSLERGGRMALLDELYLEPAARGRGVGKAALRAAERMARDAGCNAVVLELDEGNARARELYMRAGFKELGRKLLTLSLT